MKIKVTKGPWDGGCWLEIEQPFVREDFEWSDADESVYVSPGKLLAALANEHGYVHVTVPGVIGRVSDEARDQIVEHNTNIGYSFRTAHPRQSPRKVRSPGMLPAPFASLRRCKSVPSMRKILADYSIRVELEQVKHREEWVAAAIADMNADLVGFCERANERLTRSVVQTVTGPIGRDLVLAKLTEGAPARVHTARVDSLREKIRQLREELVHATKNANWHVSVAVINHMTQEDWTINDCKLPAFVVDAAHDALNKTAASEDIDHGALVLY